VVRIADQFRGLEGGAFKSMPDKIRWGVISGARIADRKVIPAIQRSGKGVVEAIASRSEARAKELAGRHRIPRAYGSYEALLGDPEIDAIYNPLPNHLHVEWTIAALEAGKHVLCEKPLGMSAAEVERLRDVRPDLHLMEAFMVRYHPQWLRARELARSGRIGELRAVHVFFSFWNRDPDNIRNVPAFGGGALMDIGCYGIVSGRFLFEAEPKRVVALIDRDPEFGTDRLSSAMADFGEGRHLSFLASTQLAAHQRVTACGTKGRIEIVVPFNAPPTETTRILIDDGSRLGGASSVEERLAPIDQYAEEADAFARAILGEEPPRYGREDAVRNMRILDALYRSAAAAGWEPTGL
jgi:predicted dehydrogenase